MSPTLKNAMPREAWVVGLACRYLVASFPLIGGAILISVAGHSASASTLISVPIVAVSMGVEPALVDAIFFRVLLKGYVRAQSRALLIASILNATIALTLGLA
jgi:hypothetical protein